MQTLKFEKLSERIAFFMVPIMSVGLISFSFNPSLNNVINLTVYEKIGIIYIL